MHTGRVIVVGSVNVDLVVTTRRLPGPGETVIGGDLARHHGGKGANQAVAAARLGADVTFIGAVGDDEMGTSARDALAAEGIAVDRLVRVFRPTGVALIIVDLAGENLIAVGQGANGAVSAAAVREALAALGLGPGDVVVVSREIPRRSVLAALQGARAASAIGMLNPAPADDIDGATIELADVMTPNLSELALITGEAEPEAGARALLRMTANDRPKPPAPAPPPGRPVYRAAARESVAPDPAAAARRFVAVTLGAGGALLVTAAGSAVAIPTPSVRPVDTTGAGDAFSGALAAALAAGLQPQDAVRRAVHAAALSTRHPGAREGMPTLDELRSRFPAL
jgi:ribokinase